MKWLKIYFTQSELNEVCKKPIYYYPNNYSNAVVLILYTSAYITMFPLGAVLTFIGLFFMYWMAKIGIAHYYCTEWDHVDKMLGTAIKLVALLCPTIMIVMNILFEIMLEDW